MALVVDGRDPEGGGGASAAIASCRPGTPDSHVTAVHLLSSLRVGGRLVLLGRRLVVHCCSIYGGSRRSRDGFGLPRQIVSQKHVLDEAARCRGQRPRGRAPWQQTQLRRAGACANALVVFAKALALLRRASSRRMSSRAEDRSPCADEGSGARAARTRSAHAREIGAPQIAASRWRA